MSKAPLMVGVSGLRGIVGESLTPEVAARFAGAFGGWLGEKAAEQQSSKAAKQGRPRVVIGRDGRAGGATFHAAAGEALTSVGCDVVDLGVAMTPSVGVMVDYHHAAGGLIVSASHNPQEWNGIKVLIRERLSSFGEPIEPEACAPAPMAAREIIERFRRNTATKAASTAGSLTSFHQTMRVHEGRIVFGDRIVGVAVVGGGVKTRLQPWWIRGGPTCVLDSVNASGARPGRSLLQSLGCQVVAIGADDNGIFPHPPEPLRENLTALSAEVKATGAAVGFAQDPDADRLAIVNERGEYIGEEYTLVLAAEALLGADRVGLEARPPGPSVLVTNLSTSRMIDDVAARHGARVIRTAVGEANVVEAMKREKAAGADVVLGGEGNGGVIWPRVTYVRDSLSAMALVLALMARTGKTVSELVAGMPRYAIEKRKVDLARKEDAVRGVEKIAAHWKQHRVDRQDGVRVDFSQGPLAGKAWVHVRASNTEPIMRLIAEAPEAGQARAILDEAARVIG